jgi:hypothetical protein
MNKQVLEEILETVAAYYLTNKDVLPDDALEDLKNQMSYLELLIKEVVNDDETKDVEEVSCNKCKYCINQDCILDSKGCQTDTMECYEPIENI